jgi:PilZ domain
MAMPATNDRRQFARIEAKWPVTALVERSEVGVELANLSPVGVLIYSKEPLSSQKDMRLFITAPDHHTLQAEGSVVWSASGAMGEHEPGYRAGIRFTHLAEHDRLYLTRVISGIDKPGRWPQSTQIQATNVLAFLVLIVLIGILYFNLDTKMNDISKNVLPRVETALQKVEERTAPLVTLQEDIDVMASIRQEASDARRDIGVIVEKINSVLMPAVEGLQRKVYGQPVALERIALLPGAQAGRAGEGAEAAGEVKNRENPPDLLSEPQAKSTEIIVDRKLAFLGTSPPETTPRSYRRLKLGTDLYGVAELTTLEGAAPSIKQGEQTARANAKTKLLTLIESRINEILRELASATGMDFNSVSDSLPKQIPERIGTKIAPVVTLSQVAQKEGREEIQVLLTVKKGDVLPLVEGEVEKEVLASSRFSPEERKEAQSKFKSILEAESKKPMDVLWKIQ